MKFKGLTKSTAPHFAESASHFGDFSQADPNCATSWSATINPMLCRVATYSEPGFPRPAMSRIAVSSTRGQSKTENGLLLLFLFWSLFFPSWSRRSSFAFFLFLGDHFRSCGGSLSFRCNWCFLNHRSHHGEGR